MREYHKIEGLYVREEGTKRLIPGVYRNHMVEFLKDVQWLFTEKIDGTNIRVVWDGHRVSFYGRTDKATIPPMLMEALDDRFGGESNEQMFEQLFGDKHVVLYGEGYGAKIQNGDGYLPERNDFILFDVEINDRFLNRENVVDISKNLGIPVVHCVCRGTIQDGVDFVKNRPMSRIGNAKMEGVVGRPRFELFDQNGNRVIVKIKVRDFDEIDRYKE